MKAALSRGSMPLALVAALFASCAVVDDDVVVDEESGLSKRLEERVDAIVAPLVAENELSGAIVLARHGRVLYQRGFGMANREAGVDFTPETASDGGSLAKTFTAAGLQWLAHEGRVDLDAPAVRYLPEYPHPETTLRQLISHNNGLPPYYEFFDPHFEPTEVRTTEAMLRVVAREVATPAFAPGSRFEYSNFAFDLAALVIERVTGQKYEDFVEQRFFSPLAMRSSFARPARLADWQGVRTLGYRWRDDDWQLVEVFDMEGFLGASNLYFSAVDLARWASANASGTAMPAAVFEAGQNRALIGDQPSPITGLSWYCDEDGLRCYYTGDINAFHGFVYWDRDRDEAAVLLSNSSLSPWRIITLQRALVDALAGRPVRTELPVSFEPLDKAVYSAFAGTFMAEGMGAVHVVAAAQRLRLRPETGLEFDAFEVSREILYVPGADYWIGFSGGQPPTALHLRSMFLDTVAHRIH